jgi:cytochrome c553
VGAKDDKAENTKKNQAMTEHLSNTSSQDLYALMRYYGTQKGESAIKSWATTANEVLLDRMLKDLRSQLGQQKGWEAKHAAQVVKDNPDAAAQALAEHIRNLTPEEREAFLKLLQVDHASS